MRSNVIIHTICSEQPIDICQANMLDHRLFPTVHAHTPTANARHETASTRVAARTTNRHELAKAREIAIMP
jgi:hypothetical protein